jgi:hypothetical protein
MKSIIVSLLVLATSTFLVEARFIASRTFRELEKQADIIVVARPISTKDTAEFTNLRNIAPDIPVVGLSTEFEVSMVLKGDSSLKKVVVHHYRLANPLPGNVWDAGFALASFDPNQPVRYLMFLQREADGRFAPSDQNDPARTAMLKLDGPGWDKMGPDDLKKWLDAQKWLNQRPPLGEAMSAAIPPGGEGAGSLHEAALNGKLEKAKALIKANPGLVNNQDSYASQSPLHMAAEYGHRDVAELLLANKADVEAKAHGGWTPLLNAVFGGHKNVVELLLAHKADVNFQEEAGRSPLHVAAENGYTEIAALLLAHKANVNAKNREGMTPLHVAVALGYKDLANLLISSNADMDAKDNQGRTALDLAMLHGDKDLTALLRQRGGLR